MHLGYILYTENHSANVSVSDRYHLNLTDALSSLFKMPENYSGYPLLPDFLANPYFVNATLDIHIPKYSLYDNENVYKRLLWGTDVYTDDSDIVAILYHQGILHSHSPLSDNGTDNSDNNNIISTETTDIPIQQLSEDNENISDVLVVTVRLLPPLLRYPGTFQHSYNSRSFTSHDGISLRVECVKWITLLNT